MTEKEQQIFDMQSPSYKAAMSQTEAERVMHKLSIIPKEAQCVKEDGSVDLNVRFISAADEKAYQIHRRATGERFEEARKSYLMAAGEKGKIHSSLMDKIETPHVMPSAEQRERGIKAFMGGFTIKEIGKKFKEIMQAMFTHSYAEIVSQEMKKRNSDD